MRLVTAAMRGGATSLLGRGIASLATRTLRDALGCGGWKGLGGVAMA